VDPSRIVVALLFAVAPAAPLAAAQAGDAKAPEAAPPTTSTEAMSAAGYSGGTLTPSARTLPYGTLGLRYDPTLVGVASRPEGHNYVLGVGLLPYVEVAGRIAAHDLHCNLYMPGACDTRGWLRDLSMSFKVAVPLDERQRFSVAAGAVDVGGAATNFRSYYGVLGFREGPFDATLGYGSSDARHAVLTGLFGRVSVRLLESLEIAAERVPAGTWLSARAFAPAAWLPDRWQVYADANRRLGDQTTTVSNWFGFGIGIPLDVRGLGGSTAVQREAAERSPSPLFRLPDVVRPAEDLLSEASRTAPPAVPSAGASAASAGAAPAVAAAPAIPASEPVDAARLARIQRALADAGVEDIDIGLRDSADGDPIVVVRADNGAWRWSDLDAMGVVLARVVRALPEGDPRVRVVIGRRGVPTVAVDGSARCIEALLRSGADDCPAARRPRILASGQPAFAGLLDDVRWVHRGGQPSWGRTRVTVGPGLRTGVATEYGVWDYSLAAEVTVEVPLWRGASIDARRTFPLSNSADFDDGRVFGLDRHRTVTDRVLLHQTVPLANGLSARGAVGRIYDDWRGGLGEVRWQPGEGTQRLSAMAGRFENGGSLRKGFTAEPALASYRYFVAPLDWAIELTAGRFFLNDTGWALASRHWFGEVAVVASMRQTRHPNALSGERFAGLAIELPLTPRRALDTRWLQLQGVDRWSYGIETLVGNDHNRLTGGHGIVPPVTNGLDAVHDTDRAFGAFVQRNWARIREAAALADPAR